MPVQVEQTRPRGIRFPPNGWTLVVLLALYIFTGLIGHDPWKNDDALTIGVIHEMVATGNWLLPGLAGQPYPDDPLYYWVGASSSSLLSWLLPIHDAARLASGLFTLLALGFIFLAARELHDREQATAAPLLLAGSIGFLLHSHEAQPMLATLTAHAAAYWSLALLDRKPLRGAVCFAFALGLGFLANGLAPMLPLLPVAAFAVWRSANRRRLALLLLAALLLAGVLGGWWLAFLFFAAPTYLAGLLQSELTQFSTNSQPLLNLRELLFMLPWYAWPAFPLAGWTLWAKRRQLTSLSLALPIFAFVVSLVIVGITLGARSVPALLLLPPLVLLAVPGVSSLRRGAANAFDWFGMITFSLFALLAWIGWSAMVFGWPERLARQAVHLQPGFVGHFSGPASGFAVLATLLWCWLIATSVRSPTRGIMHWMAGLTLFWLLIVTLWMPWIDYGKTYRQASAALANALPEKRDCIARVNVSDAIVASLDYFDGIRTVAASPSDHRKCELLLIHGTANESGVSVGGGWRQIWEGGRPAERRESEKLHLYRREPKKSPMPSSK